MMAARARVSISFESIEMSFCESWKDDEDGEKSHGSVRVRLERL